MTIEKLKKLKLESDKFYLRLLKSSDLNERYLSWLHDKEVVQYLKNPNKLLNYKMRDLKEYYKSINFNKKLIFAIVDKKKELHVGNMTLNPIDTENHKTGLGGMIGEKKYWGSTAFIDGMRLLIDYAFNERKFIKIESGVFEPNVACIIASKKVGFKIEGVKKKDIIINNQTCDSYLFGLINKKNEKYHLRS